MLENRSGRAYSNLKMLEFVARRLGTLNDEVVYLGGCTTALFISDPLSLDVRSTRDVDCIVDVVSLIEYYNFGEKLKEQGFKQRSNESILCRWYCEDIILDVMSPNKEILGFESFWYKKAIQQPILHQITENINIKSVTAPYLLATKIEAFKSRGQNDFWGSHDFEDIITIIAGRIEIVDEIAMLKQDILKSHLKEFFKEIIYDDKFKSALPGHVNDGPITLQRVQMVMNRIQNIIDN